MGLHEGQAEQCSGHVNRGAPRKAAPWEPSRKPVRRRMALRLTRRSRLRLAAGDVPCSKCGTHINAQYSCSCELSRPGQRACMHQALVLLEAGRRYNTGRIINT